MKNVDLKGLYEGIYKGKHGQSENEYQDDRSDAGKMISGDSKGSGANYAYKAKNTGPNPAGGKEKPQGQARMGQKDRDYLAYRKANMKKEEVELTEEEKKSKKDACYHKVKSRYSVWPSAYASGALVKCRQKGAKNWGNKKEDMEMAFAYLMNEGFCDTEHGAINMLDSMSDEWLESIIEQLEEME